MRRCLTLLLLATACARPPGGRDGQDGRSCKVEHVGAGGAGGSGGGALARIACDDGTAALSPPLDGRSGVAGRRGDQGRKGPDGDPFLAALEEIPPAGPEQPGAGCPDGGVRLLGSREAGGEAKSSEVCRPATACRDPATGLARLTGDLHLENELDLRRFLLAGCTEIDGALRVGGDSFTSLYSDLAALRRLRSVTGNVELAFIAGALSGLEGLDAVGGALWIHDLPLRSLAGLQGLREIGGDLVLGCHLQLTDVSALLGLRRVGGDLRVAQSEWAEALHDVQVAGRVLVEACPR